MSRGWQSQVPRCEATRSLYVVDKTSWLTRFQKRVLTEASCGSGTLPVFGGATLRNGRSFIHWQLSRFDDESPHSQQQAAAGESCSGLQQSKDGLGCF